MTKKQQVLREIEQLPDTEPLWDTFSQLLESRKTTTATFKGRPLIQIEDITEDNWPYPPEPEWEERWKDANK